jgi:hypothetical protein
MTAATLTRREFGAASSAAAAAVVLKEHNVNQCMDLFFGEPVYSYRKETD